MSLSISLSEFQNATPISITALLLISALTFVTALSWNNLVEATLDKYIEDKNSVRGHIIYASMTTVILFTAVYFLTQKFSVIKN